MLINAGDPERAGLCRRKVRDLFASDRDRPRVRLMRAGDDFDERGFPRAILAEQCVDFTADQVKGDAFERTDRAEGFLDR